MLAKIRLFAEDKNRIAEVMDHVKAPISKSGFTRLTCIGYAEERNAARYNHRTSKR